MGFFFPGELICLDFGIVVRASAHSDLREEMSS